MSRSSPENHRAFAQRNVMTESIHDIDVVTNILSTAREKRFLRISTRNIEYRSAVQKNLHCKETALWRRAFVRHSKTILRIVVMWNFKV